MVSHDILCADQNLGDLPLAAYKLLGLIKELEINFGIERSFKVQQNRLSKDRCLFSLSNLPSKLERDNRDLNLCKQIQLPKEWLPLAKKAMEHSDTVHFGFETDSVGYLYKVYFEYRAAYLEQLPSAIVDRKSILGCLAIKWEPDSQSRKALTRYTVNPHYTLDNYRNRIRDIFRNSSDELVGISIDVLEKVSALASKDLLFLEVDEEGNSRKSFDINAYDSGLDIGSMYTSLLPMVKHFEISKLEFTKLFHKIKNMSFGHLSGGIDRKGNKFFYGLLWYGSVQRLSWNVLKPRTANN
jgi:hypothetical protein